MAKLDDLKRTLGGNVAESASMRPAVAAPTLAALTSARMNGVARSKGALDIPLDRIEPDPDQPREEFDADALERLAASLKTRGQLQPVRVRWEESRGVYMLVCGERRWRAAKMAGLSTLACVVSEGPIEPGELLALQLIENCVREDLAPLDQARAFRSLMDRMGWSGHRLAQELGVSQSNVVRALALLDLPTEVQTQVDTGALPASVAYELSKAEDPETIRELAAEVATSGLTRSEAVKAVRERSRRSASKTKGKPLAVKARTFRSSLGRVEVTLRKAGDMAAMLAVLEDAAAQIRAEQGSGTVEAA